MSDQPEALRLADWLVKVAGPWPGSSFSKNELRAAIFLQEQYAEIERLREQLRLANIDALNETAENERLRGALKGIETLKVTVGGLPATAFQAEGWMRELAREALKVKP